VISIFVDIWEAPQVIVFEQTPATINFYGKSEITFYVA
jgi:hypothetical protein